MRKITTLLALTVVSWQLIAQTTGRIEGLKDGWGTTYDYIGEIKNNQPNGVGVAIYYNTSTALRYTGHFVNGLFNGEGVLLFEDSTFLCGNWKDGKLNGNGAQLNSGGTLYVGSFANGVKDGKGTFVFSDKSILAGNMKNDTYEGRCIYIPASAKLISDNIYVNGKKNGTGYQYELDSKTLFEGTWKDGDWVSSGTASYMSFLKDKNFLGEKNDNHVIMGIIDYNNNSYMQDTGFNYLLKTGTRNFGMFDKGYLAEGVRVKDSTVFFGKINDIGAYGQGALYKIKNYFDLGNYINDFLNGPDNISISLKNMTTYCGSTSDSGYFTGKAIFSNKYSELFNGEYVKGQFTGKGYITYSNGTTIKGIFKNSIPSTVTSLTNGKGAPINRNPKTISEGLSSIMNEYQNDYVSIQGDYADEDNYSLDDYYQTGNCLITLPGSIGENVILEDWDFYLYYESTFYNGTSFNDAAAKYNALCKEVKSGSYKLVFDKSPITLSGTIEEPEESDTTRSMFTVQNVSSLGSYNIYVSIVYDSGNYKVLLDAGDLTFDDK